MSLTVAGAMASTLLGTAACGPDGPGTYADPGAPELPAEEQAQPSDTDPDAEGPGGERGPPKQQDLPDDQNPGSDLDPTPGDETPDGTPPDGTPDGSPPDGTPDDGPEGTPPDGTPDDGPGGTPPDGTPDDGPDGTPPDGTPSDPIPFTILLVHGFGGFADIGEIEGFAGVRDHLEGLGTEEEPIQVFSPALPPVAGTLERAAILGSAVDDALAETGADKAQLICHSQGGIDCRALVSTLGYHDRVAAIVTVGSPHHGTPLADMAAEAPEGFLNPAGVFMATLIGLADNPPTQADWSLDQLVESANAADVAGAISAMTAEGAAAFNEATPDHPDVPVFSVAGVSRNSDGDELCEGGSLFGPVDQTDPLSAPLILSGLAIASTPDLEGNTSLAGRDNDGVVPTDSMIWGEFLGCVGADHLDEIGQAPGILGSFDHLEMYEALLGHLLAQ